MGSSGCRISSTVGCAAVRAIIAFGSFTSKDFRAGSITSAVRSSGFRMRTMVGPIDISRADFRIARIHSGADIGRMGSRIHTIKDVHHNDLRFDSMNPPSNSAVLSCASSDIVFPILVSQTVQL